MADSNDFIPLYAEKIYLGGKEHHVRTRCGSVSVIVYGDQDKPALITYPDLALNHMSCFQGLFFCPEAAYLLLHNFCIYHISPPGHEVKLVSIFLFARLCSMCTTLSPWYELNQLFDFIINIVSFLALSQEFFQLGADPIYESTSPHSVDDLADQILEVLNFFGLGAVMCIGVTAGAYILTLFAMKYRDRVLGLILVSPLCRAPSWTEWFYNKLLDERHASNVMRFLQAINGRPDLTSGLKRLRCRTLIFVGDSSPFHSEALYMTSKFDRRFSALVEVQACGSMVTEEQPHAMLIPMEYFFMRYGLYRPMHLSGSPRSPLNISCISPELLSPESMGLNLEPIKTRVSLEV